MIVLQQNLFMNNRSLWSNGASQNLSLTIDAMHTLVAKSYGTVADRKHFPLPPTDVFSFHASRTKEHYKGERRI